MGALLVSGNIVPGQKRPLSPWDGRVTPGLGFGSRLPPCSASQTPALNGGFEPEARLGSSPFERVPAGTAGGPFRREVLVPCQQEKTLHSSKIGSLLPTGVWRGRRGTKTLQGWQAVSLWSGREGTLWALLAAPWPSTSQGWGCDLQHHPSIPPQHPSGMQCLWLQREDLCGTSQGVIPSSKSFHPAAGMKPGSTYLSPWHLYSPATKQDIELSSMHNSQLN